MDENEKRRKRMLQMCDGNGKHDRISFDGLGVEDCPLCKLMGRLEALREKLGAEYKPAAQG